jgi:hypothetical protein
MQKTLQILIASLKLAFQELYKNKLRTFLSLFGVTIGIFCIIGVLSTVSSLELSGRSGLSLVEICEPSVGADVRSQDPATEDDDAAGHRL